MTEQEFADIKRENGGRFFVPKRASAPQVEPKLTITKRITADVHEYKYFTDFPKRPE